MGMRSLLGVAWVSVVFCLPAGAIQPAGVALELSGVKRVGRLVLFAPVVRPEGLAEEPTWVLPTALHSRLDCPPVSDPRSGLCLLRLFNSATEDEARGVLKSQPIGDRFSSPLIEIESALEAPLALPGSSIGGPALDPLSFRPARQPFAVLAFRANAGVSEIYEGEGVGELSILVRLRARRTHEQVSLQDEAALRDLVSIFKARSGLLEWVNSQSFLLHGIEPREAPRLVHRLLEWRRDANEIPSTPVLFQATEQGLELQCRVRLKLKKGEVSSIQCTEKSS